MTELILSCVVKKERRGGYSALCPELDIASRGDTLEEARENLQEAVAGHLKVAREEGMLGDILNGLGIDERALRGKEDHLVVQSFSTSLTVQLPA